jgi:hypothetical protein
MRRGFIFMLFIFMLFMVKISLATNGDNLIGVTPISIKHLLEVVQKIL